MILFVPHVSNSVLRKKLKRAKPQEIIDERIDHIYRSKKYIIYKYISYIYFSKKVQILALKKSV